MITAGQRRTGLAMVGCVLASLGLTATQAVAMEAPAAVKAAIEKTFPGATIAKVEREREDGVAYFEVDLRQGDQEFSAEVTAEGTIGEVETEVAVKDLPKAVAAKLKEVAAGAEVRSAEKHEVRGVPVYGTFAALATPVTAYEIKVRAPGATRNTQVVLRDNGQVIPTRGGGGDNDDDDDDDGDDD